MLATQILPFEVTIDEILQNIDNYIDAVFSCLESDFLIMPKGSGFIEFPVFEDGYESLKAVTNGFMNFEPEAIVSVTILKPISFIILRTILGFTPPEWAYITSQKSNLSVSQGFIRSLDRDVRIHPLKPINAPQDKKNKIKALIKTACSLLTEGPPKVDLEQLHRLDKADTKLGVESISNLATMGVPYVMLLYERFLGRPFAGHRDSVSELIGDRLESAIENILHQAGISYRKTKRATRVEGFDQAPDFTVPSEFNPQIVIEAKITEDDGTARDKVTRIQHLYELSMEGQRDNNPKFDVIACIGGRGFKVRREDMKKLLIATKGKIFTLINLNRMLDCTKLMNFITKKSMSST
jgi:hypothetical protein